MTAPPEPRPRVLVVDDNEINRRIADVHLRHNGADAALAASGQAALDMLAAAPYDLVLLDGMMPGLDGPATAREIRRREHATGTPRIPIVALTASAMPEDRERMLEAGMDDHVTKPLNADGVGEILARWLGRDGPRTVPIAALPPVDAAGGAPGPAAGAAGPGSPTPGPMLGPGPSGHDDPGASAPTGGEASILDPAAFARLAALGDPSFVQRLVRLFLADAGERVAQVDAALDTGDPVRACGALDALEGICATIGATALDRQVRAVHARVRVCDDHEDAQVDALVRGSGLLPVLEITRLALQAELARNGGH